MPMLKSSSKSFLTMCMALCFLSSCRQTSSQNKFAKQVPAFTAASTHHSAWPWSPARLRAPTRPALWGRAEGARLGVRCAFMIICSLAKPNRVHRTLLCRSAHCRSDCVGGRASSAALPCRPRLGRNALPLLVFAAALFDCLFGPPNPPLP